MLSNRAARGRKPLALFLALGFFLALGITCLFYLKTLQIGFLLDDFVHLGYTSSAFHGDPSGFLKTFSGNWSGQTDGLTSFRPGISGSFLLDHVFYGLNPAGYHFTNLVTFSLCAVLCGVLTYQLLAGSALKERCIAAVASALLFIVYPLHAESVSWIVGRVDLFCTLFYLASLSCYLRFRKTGQNTLLALSLLTFFLSLISKEMAVTLPIVLVLAELLLPGTLGWMQMTVKRRLVYLSTFVFVLAMFAALRTYFLGTLVGGYGAGGWREILQSRHKFIEVGTLKRILFGANVEPAIAPAFKAIANVSWCVIFVSLLVRLVQPLHRLRVFAFVAAWIIVSVLPAFQIWEISPNLVGSRLFFLGSAGLCILIAVVLIPSFKHASFAQDKKFFLLLQGRAIQVAGFAALLALGIVWSAALLHNIEPWLDAGRQMHVLTSRLVDLAKDPKVDSIMLLNLPQDFEGASMIGNEDILHRALQPPVTDADYAKKITTYKDPSGLSSEAMDCFLLKDTYEKSKNTKWLLWSNVEKQWLDWTPPGGVRDFACKSFSMVTKDGLASCSTIDKPRKGRIVWLNKIEPIDPFAVTGLVLHAEISDKDPDFSSNVQLIWRSSKQPSGGADYSVGPHGHWAFDYQKNGLAIPSVNKIGFQPLHYRNWLLNGSIKDVGFILPPGTYSMKLLEMKSADLSFPRSKINSQ